MILSLAEVEIKIRKLGYPSCPSASIRVKESTKVNKSLMSYQAGIHLFCKITEGEGPPSPWAHDKVVMT